jgi:hypothetical protein
VPRSLEHQRGRFDADAHRTAAVATRDAVGVMEEINDELAERLARGASDIGKAAWILSRVDQDANSPPGWEV